MKTVKELISRGRTQDAIEELLKRSKNLKDKNLEKEIILLNNKYNRISSQLRIETIDNERYNIDISKINNNILEILNHYPIVEEEIEIKSKYKLEIVDIDFLDGANDKIDIKLRNVSNEVIFIKKVILNINKIYSIKPYNGVILYSAILPSANYDFIVPFQEAPYTVEKNISQAIKTNDIDRFTFSILPEEIPPGYHFMKFNLSFAYNKDELQIHNQELISHLKDFDFENQTPYFVDDDFINEFNNSVNKVQNLRDSYNENYQKNLNSIQKILLFKGKTSKDAKKMIKIIREMYKKNIK